MNRLDAAIYVYPWDLCDEGLQAALRRLDELGITGVQIAVAYHAGRFTLPHNPRRKLYFPEDGVVYFAHEPDRYADSLIKPRAWSGLGEGDVLRELAQECRRRGLRLTAWIVCAHNAALGTAHPECAVTNVFGDRDMTWLCPANPAVVRYLETLVRDLVTGYSVDAVLLESPEYPTLDHGFHHEKTLAAIGPVGKLVASLCFCDSCARLAARLGPIDRLRDRVRNLAQAVLDDAWGAEEQARRAIREPEFQVFLRARQDAVRALLVAIRRAADRPKPIEVRVLMWHPWEELGWYGLPPDGLVGTVDALEVQAYAARPKEVTDRLKPYLSTPFGPSNLVADLSPGHPWVRSSEALGNQLRACTDLGISRLAFYNYGLLSTPRLNWIGEVLTAAQH